MHLSSAIALGLSGLLGSVSGAAIPDKSLVPRDYDHSGAFRRIDAPPGCKDVTIPDSWYGAFLGPNWWNQATSCGACAELHIDSDKTNGNSLYITPISETIKVKVRGRTRSVLFNLRSRSKMPPDLLTLLTVFCKIFGKCENCQGADWGVPTAGFNQVVSSATYRRLGVASLGKWSYISCP